MTDLTAEPPVSGRNYVTKGYILKLSASHSVKYIQGSVRFDPSTTLVWKRGSMSWLASRGFHLRVSSIKRIIIIYIC